MYNMCEIKREKYKIYPPNNSDVLVQFDEIAKLSHRDLSF